MHNSYRQYIKSFKGFFFIKQLYLFNSQSFQNKNTKNLKTEMSPKIKTQKT